ncbi:coiled-coil domain-containing protein 166 [Hemicordylus capensis]|uniref:coiled-coil domain-containing protein 166 n=1 Tax=Hemicordylus capensis TaxID=884348 RepID=UPI002303CF56|nr:coiled-coil domain-containing protein 166 [Hemicordylus capensis]XP_053104612.1 coiled-coil domain-containing protein 166 [Hemicordylus capensis]
MARSPKKKTPKGKKGKKGKKVKKKDADKVIIAPYVSEKEKYLLKEYATLTEHVQTYTQRVRHFQWENEFLDKEAQQIRDISKAYLSYLLKRTLRCQNAIISLNDQNRSDLAQIRKQKLLLTAQYASQGRVVRTQLMEREANFSLLNKEVEAMQPLRDLQLEQLARIRELEKELLVMKVQHTDQMHKVKSRFLQQKADYEWEAQQKLQALAKLAEKEAVRVLIQHTKQVKADNWRLRHELLNFMRRAEVLKGLLLQLRGQQQELLREHQHSQDLARMRHWLRQRQACLHLTPGQAFRCSPLTKRRLRSSPATCAKAPRSATSSSDGEGSLPPASIPELGSGKPAGSASRESLA